MAKNNRFPSPANVKVDKGGRPVKDAEKKDGPLPEPIVAKSVECMKIHHKGENTVVLHNGVHAISPGLNHVPRDVMEDSMKHPHIQKLIESGELSCDEWDDEADEVEEEMKKESDEGKA